MEGAKRSSDSAPEQLALAKIVESNKDAAPEQLAPAASAHVVGPVSNKGAQLAPAATAKYNVSASPSGKGKGAQLAPAASAKYNVSASPSGKGKGVIPNKGEKRKHHATYGKDYPNKLVNPFKRPPMESDKWTRKEMKNYRKFLEFEKESGNTSHEVTDYFACFGAPDKDDYVDEEDDYVDDED